MGIGGEPLDPVVGDVDPKCAQERIGSTGIHTDHAVRAPDSRCGWMGVLGIHHGSVRLLSVASQCRRWCKLLTGWLGQVLGGEHFKPWENWAQISTIRGLASSAAVRNHGRQTL